MENRTSNHPRDILAAILNKPITVKDLKAKINPETTATKIQQEERNVSTAKIMDNNNNSVNKLPMIKQEILIKKIPIKLKNVFKTSSNVKNGKSFDADNAGSQQQKSTKSISNVLHDEKVQQNDLQEEVKNSKNNIPSTKSKDKNEKKQSSKINISGTKENSENQVSCTASVSSNSCKAKKNLDVLKTGSSCISTQESSAHSDKPNLFLPASKEKHMSEGKTSIESVSTLNQRIILKKTVMESPSGKNNTKTIDNIKARKTELLKKSHEIKTKHQQDVKQLLEQNEIPMRRIFTKEILDYEASFITTAPPLFCEKAYNISKLPPIEEKINEINCIITAQKDKIMTLLKACIENGKQVSDMLKILLNALITGDNCVLAKLNQNKILQEEVLADLKKLLGEENGPSLKN